MAGNALNKWSSNDSLETEKAARLYTKLKDGLAIVMMTKQAVFVSKASADTFRGAFPGWDVQSKEK